MPDPRALLERQLRDAHARLGQLAGEPLARDTGLDLGEDSQPRSGQVRIPRVRIAGLDAGC